MAPICGVAAWSGFFRAPRIVRSIRGDLDQKSSRVKAGEVMVLRVSSVGRIVLPAEGVRLDRRGAMIKTTPPDARPVDR
jgi:hypothetical protein